MCNYIYMKIPKTIMQTYSSKKNLTIEMIANIEAWKNLNQDWKHKMFYDNDCISFIKNHFNNDVLYAFNKIKPGAGKADLFRYCYLYIKGGVYTDMDNIPIVALNKIIKENDEFISCLDHLYKGIHSEFNGQSFGIHQSFIISKPKHPFLDMAIKLCTYNIINGLRHRGHDNNGRFNHPALQAHPLIKITGPKLLADAVNIINNKEINSGFIMNNMFKFMLIPSKVVIKNSEGKPIPNQWMSTIQDKTGNIIIKCKYDGYDSGNYWPTVDLYN